MVEKALPAEADRSVKLIIYNLGSGWYSNAHQYHSEVAIPFLTKLLCPLELLLSRVSAFRVWRGACFANVETELGFSFHDHCVSAYAGANRPNISG